MLYGARILGSARRNDFPIFASCHHMPRASMVRVPPQTWCVPKAPCEIFRSFFCRVFIGDWRLAMQGTSRLLAVSVLIDSILSAVLTTWLYNSAAAGCVLTLSCLQSKGLRHACPGMQPRTLCCTPPRLVLLSGKARLSVATGRYGPLL